jgi:hypothetical protein
MGVAMFPAAVIGASALLISVFTLGRVIGEDAAALAGMAIYIPSLAIGGGWFHRRAEEKRAAGIRELAREADARGIGPLASMIRGNVMSGSIFLLPTLDAITGSLIRLLDAVGPDDREAVSESDRAELRSILTSCANHYGPIQARIFRPAFVKAALRALTILEDAPTLHCAERMVRAVGIGKRIAELRSVALDALPDLREMARRLREREQLLRPAEAPDDAETLLRPAIGAPSDDEQRLVRPLDHQ